MILGVDLGSSKTNAVLMKGESLKKCFTFNSNTRLDIILFKLASHEIDSIAVTGAYSKGYSYSINKLPVHHVDEIKAIGMGGLYTSRKKKALIVSIGSGTAMVSCDKNIRHIGGTAMGSRTLSGLGKLLLKADDIKEIEKLASKGNLGNVDLLLSEIYPKGIGLLPPNATASHFGKLVNQSDSDIALGLVNMLAQSIGTLAVFGAKSVKQKDIVIVGGLTKVKLFKKTLMKRINSLTDVNVIIPDKAEYSTAVGAVIGKTIGI